MTKLVNPQFANAYGPMCVTVLGSMMFINETHPANASSPMVLSRLPDANMTSVRAVHPAKALGAIYVTVPGMVTLVICSFSKNALLVIPITVYRCAPFRTTVGISTCVPKWDGARPITSAWMREVR